MLELMKELMTTNVVIVAKNLKVWYCSKLMKEFILMKDLLNVCSVKKALELIYI